MSSEDQVLSALKALAEQDRGVEAPARVEAALMGRFRRQRAVRRYRWIAAGSMAAAAGFVAFLMTTYETAPTPIEAKAPVTVATEPEAVATVVEEPPAKPQRRAARRAAQPQIREVATEFFPLVDVEMPFETGELRRVVVPASTMLRMGLPVNENRLMEPVQADVLIGQEGLARAIRFVSYEQR